MFLLDIKRSGAGKKKQPPLLPQHSSTQEKQASRLQERDHNPRDATWSVCVCVCECEGGNTSKGAVGVLPCKAMDGWLEGWGG